MINKTLTNCAIMKAVINNIPGRSMKDQLRDRVTNIRAWLTILTCRYSAAIISSRLPLIDFTPNFSCIKRKKRNVLKLSLNRNHQIWSLRILISVSYREEVGIPHYPEEYNSHQCQVTSENNTRSEDLFQFPAIGQWGWLHPIL